jgi:hypothetical protein
MIQTSKTKGFFWRNSHLNARHLGENPAKLWLTLEIASPGGGRRKYSHHSVVIFFWENQEIRCFVFYLAWKIFRILTFLIKLRSIFLCGKTATFLAIFQRLGMGKIVAFDLEYEWHAQWLAKKLSLFDLEYEWLIFTRTELAKKMIAVLRWSRVAYCCFSMVQISPLYGVKQLKVSWRREAKNLSSICTAAPLSFLPCYFSYSQLNQILMHNTMGRWQVLGK